MQQRPRVRFDVQPWQQNPPDVVAACHHGNAVCVREAAGRRPCRPPPKRCFTQLLSVSSLQLIRGKRTRTVHHILKYNSNHHGNGRSGSLRRTLFSEFLTFGSWGGTALACALAVANNPNVRAREKDPRHVWGEMLSNAAPFSSRSGGVPH